MNTDDNLVWDLLEQDQAYRYKGVTGDIIPYVHEGKDWRGTLPTFFEPNMISIKERPEHKQLIDLGFVVNPRTNIAYAVRSIINTTDDEVLHKIEKYIAPRIRNYKRTDTLIDNFSEEEGLSISLYVFDTLSELLHHFLSPLDAIIYDGKTMWTTPLGQFALTYGIIIIEPTANDDYYTYSIESGIFPHVLNADEGILSEIDRDRLINTTVYAANFDLSTNLLHNAFFQMMGHGASKSSFSEPVEAFYVNPSIIIVWLMDRIMMDGNRLAEHQLIALTGRSREGWISISDSIPLTRGIREPIKGYSNEEMMLMLNKRLDKLKDVMLPSFPRNPFDGSTRLHTGVSQRTISDKEWYGEHFVP